MRVFPALLKTVPHRGARVNVSMSDTAKAVVRQQVKGRSKVMTTANVSLVKSIPSNVSVALANVKTGMTGVRLMNRKEYRVTHNLGRSEAEKAHNAYLRENGVKANQNVAARIAGGELLITGIKEYSKTGKGMITFVDASKVVDKVAEPVKAAVATEDEALQAAAGFLGITVEALKAMKAASSK